MTHSRRQVVSAVAATAPAHGVRDFVVVSRSHPQRRDAVLVTAQLLPPLPAHVPPRTRKQICSPGAVRFSPCPVISSPSSVDVRRCILCTLSMTVLWFGKQVYATPREADAAGVKASLRPLLHDYLMPLEVDSCIGHYGTPKMELHSSMHILSCLRT